MIQKKYITQFFLFLAFTLGAPHVFAQITPKPELIAKASTWQGQAAIEVQVRLEPKWHITSHNPSDEFAFGANVEVPNSPGEVAIKISQVIWPTPTIKFIESIGMENSFYEGSFSIIIVVDPTAGPQKLKGKEVVLHYQSCTQELCLAPAQVSTVVW